MKKSLLIMVSFYSFLSFADPGNDISENCIKLWKNPSGDLITACRNITNLSSFECVNALDKGAVDNEFLFSLLCEGMESKKS